jgi:hypothetical protein
MLNNKTSNQLLWILYIILLVITSGTTGESLARTFEVANLWGRLVCYGVSFTLLAILYSFGLSQIKKKAQQGQRQTVYWYIAMFAVLWIVASVYTNTHSIYILLNKNEIRRAELSAIDNNLRGLKENTYHELENIKQEFKLEVEGVIVALVKQITDPQNGFFGKEARAHLNELKKYLVQ